MQTACEAEPAGPFDWARSAGALRSLALSALAEDHTERGLTAEELLKRVPGSWSLADMSAVLRALVVEDKAFYMVDDWHFAAL